VLVVDDEPDVLLGLQMLVESMGVEVRTAGGGEEALQVIGAWFPHLVLSDIMMKGMTGLELLDTLQQHHPTIKILLITAFGTIDLAVSSLQRGAVHFITKPFDNNELRARIRVAERMVAVQESLATKVGELQTALDRYDQGVGNLRLVGNQAQHLADPVQPGTGAGEFRRTAHQVDHRRVQHADVPEESDKVSRR